MDIYNINDIKKLLSSNGFRFSKSMGQNFLIDGSIPERIVRESGIDKTCGVLEIGPGIGSLTVQLAAAAGKVTAVELDRSLLNILGMTLADFGNTEVICADALKLDLPELVSTSFAGLRPVVCANIPYNITSPIIAKLIDAAVFDTVTLMMQREVAMRLCAMPGTEDYGAFTVYVNYHAEPRRLFDVPPAAFIPQPKVTSTVMNLKIRKSPAVHVTDKALFFKVVRASFAQRRKLLINGLLSAFGDTFSRDELASILKSCGFPDTQRGETLDLAGFALLSDKIFEKLS